MPRLLGITLLVTVSWNASSKFRSSMLQSFCPSYSLQLCLRSWATKVTYF